MLRSLGKTGLEIAPLVFGGNVLGWTIDEKTSFQVLDAFIDHGFNAIDTADVYSAWASGNKGGESETIIGKWLKGRAGIRDKVTIFTKVGSDLGVTGKKGLSEKWILQAVDESLNRLGVGEIDLYFSHWPDPETSYEETLGGYDKLLKAGKVRAIGASNYNVEQLSAALKVAKDKDLPAYQVLQPEYNLYNRASYDGGLRELCIKLDLGVLSGKYRSKADLGKSKRGEGTAKYLDERGLNILKALDKVSARHQAKPAEIALAWLMARDGVTAPIASATSVTQVESFARAANLTLTADDVAALDTASL